MDNRWRFLYCSVTEMWGRMEEAWAGKGKTGASGIGEGPEKPSFNPKTLSGANESSEARGCCAEKSRYRSQSTRTENRHRWMGRESQGRREKHC